MRRHRFRTVNKMHQLFIGVDTSNYTTSLAAADSDGKIIANIKINSENPILIILPFLGNLIPKFALLNFDILMSNQNIRYAAILPQAPNMVRISNRHIFFEVFHSYDLLLCCSFCHMHTFHADVFPHL